MVRINDGKPLRLIFDTGAEGVLISRKAAKKLGLEYIGLKQFGGLGSGEPSEGMIGLARSLSIGELRMKNCLVDVIESVPGGDGDGIIGPSLLQRFVIRFHASRERLELEPFPDEAGYSQKRPWWGVNRKTPAGMERFTKALHLGHFLLAPARRDGRTGYYLIDTGAAFSVVPHGGRESTESAEVFGADGRLDGATHAEPVRFQITGKSVTDSEVIASDLDKISAWAGLEISGVIGFPALSQNVLTINYRDGLIDVGR